MKVVKFVTVVSCIGGVTGHPLVEKNVIVNQGVLPSYSRIGSTSTGLLGGGTGLLGGTTTYVGGTTPLGLTSGTYLTSPLTTTGSYLGTTYGGATTTIGGGLRGSLSPFTTRTTTIVEERPAYQFY